MKTPRFRIIKGKRNAPLKFDWRGPPPPIDEPRQVTADSIHCSLSMINKIARRLNWPPPTPLLDMPEEAS